MSLPSNATFLSSDIIIKSGRLKCFGSWTHAYMLMTPKEIVVVRKRGSDEVLLVVPLVGAAVDVAAHPSATHYFIVSVPYTNWRDGRGMTLPISKSVQVLGGNVIVPMRAQSGEELVRATLKIQLLLSSVSMHLAVETGHLWKPPSLRRPHITWFYLFTAAFVVLWPPRETYSTHFGPRQQ